MIRMKRILAATDFSEFGSLAVRYACELATAFSAELHLIHVVVPPMANYSEFGLGYAGLVEFEEDLVKQGVQQLKELPGKGFEQLVVVREVRTGQPFQEIIKYARGSKIDMIVTGTHGRGAIAHMLLGNTAEKVVRTAPCPVLTVREGQHQFVMP